MDTHDLNRRDFHRLAVAALGGVIAGTAVGCTEVKQVPVKPVDKGASSGAESSKPDTAETSAEPDGEEVAQVEGEPHACSGLNACKNQGATGKNDCAGQGECATKAWHHTCGGQNECKGQGGCGTTATINDCKGKGACHIPLMAGVWKTARKHFEEKMTADGKEFGQGSPPKKKLKLK